MALLKAEEHTPKEIAEWIMRRTKAVVGGAKTLLDYRNAGAGMRKMEKEEVWNTIKEKPLEVDKKVGAKLVPGPAKIQGRIPMRERVEEVREEIRRVQRRFRWSRTKEEPPPKVNLPAEAVGT